MSDERYDECWHCGTRHEPGKRPRCEFCPDECVVEGCDEQGCLGHQAHSVMLHIKDSLDESGDLQIVVEVDGHVAVAHVHRAMWEAFDDRARELLYPELHREKGS